MVRAMFAAEICFTFSRSLLRLLQQSPLFLASTRKNLARILEEAGRSWGGGRSSATACSPILLGLPEPRLGEQPPGYCRVQRRQ